MKLLNKLGATAAALTLALLTSVVVAQDDRFANVTIETIPVAGNISILSGSGGNIGVSAGEDGILIVDDQYAPLAGRIRQALTALGSDAPEFVLNTHFHGDHTGSNADFGATGIIVAHENVRGRLQSMETAAVALPVITYDDDVTLHFNGEDITLIHMPAGHTDTDSVVLFAESNVIHMGDHFFNGAFPFIDLANGGTVQGYLFNLEKALSWIADDTRVIPGHGPLGTKADLLAFYNVIKDTSIEIRVMKSLGKSKDEITAEGLDPSLESWGAGFISEARWIETVYDSYRR
jgi:glyoxylase-like metal-dependent hydrolase (beta-lactamase superfamily II)